MEATLNARLFLRALKGLRAGKITYAQAAALYGKQPAHWSRLLKTYGEHIENLEELFKNVSKVLENSKKRAEIVQKYAKIFEVSEDRVNILLKDLGVATPNVKSVRLIAKEREQTAKWRQAVLKGAAEVIAGNGTPKAIEETTGVSYRTIYREVYRMLPPGMTMLDLKKMTNRQRTQLADQLEARRKAYLDAKYDRLTSYRPFLTPKNYDPSL